jgi:HrpA-like RNA helicase
MTSDEDAKPIAGWAVSGAEHDINSAILYLTDGLLREQLLHDENLITDQTKLNKSVVFFLDEVHERSINIDLCLALLARLLSQKPHLKSKMKLVISSATLDSSVPSLFREMNQLKFTEFTMPKLGTLYPVSKHERPNDNIIALVQELNKKRQRNEQILCFVSSVADVHLGCRLLQEVSSGSIIAYPLVQSQSATEQQMYIEQGSIFFSTTVAETSLTFPFLRYVIDTGMINMPVYDFKKQQAVLEKIRAAESTIKQRLGRLGRTQPGDYYSLYDFKVDEKKFPTPQICQSELTNIELSLRKSPAQESLNGMKKFLPNKPPQEAIDMALKKLRWLGK